MTKAQIRAAIIRIQSEQMALYPDIPESYYQLYRPKPREPAQTGTIRNDPKQTDLAYQIGKAMARIMRRVLK